MRSLAQCLHDGTAVGDRSSWAAFPHPRFTRHQKQKHTTNRNQWRILRCHIGKFKKHCYSRSSCQSLWGEPPPEGFPIPIRKPPSPSAAVHHFHIQKIQKRDITPTGRIKVPFGTHTKGRPKRFARYTSEIMRKDVVS
jgi:hypothetical protein